MNKVKLIEWAARRIFKRPLFLLVKPMWIERNEPLTVLDVSSDLKGMLARKGNEDGHYVLIGFDVTKET